VPTSDRFATLIERITPTPVEESRYSAHLATVTQAVKNALKTVRAQTIGSFARGTAVRGVSDLDLMVVLSAPERDWGGRNESSVTVLKKVKSVLTARFWNTEMRKDGSAVVVQFASGDRPVDVVPGFYVGPASRLSNYPVFAIPDGAGRWLETSPEAHGRYIQEQDAHCGGKLKRLAMLAKFWAACHPQLNLHSFHTEIVIAYREICAGPKSYATALHELFRVLSDRGGQGIRDPLRLSGIIPASAGPSGAERLAAAARSAAGRSARAIDAEHSQDTPEAIRLWKIASNGDFPS
jgi:hypothetical protein